MFTCFSTHFLLNQTIILHGLFSVFFITLSPFYNIVSFSTSKNARFLCEFQSEFKSSIWYIAHAFRFIYNVFVNL